MRTTAYLGTVNHHEPEGQALIKEFRDSIRGTGFYIKLQGRLGKDNENAWKYRKSGIMRNRAQCIHLKDAQYADMYIYKR